MPSIVLFGGMPASGKSTAVKAFKLFQKSMGKHWEVLSRDASGGKVRDLIPRAESLLKANTNVVLDNTFLTIPERKPFIDLAKSLGVEINCKFMATEFADCQLNACLRQIERTGTLMMPEDFKGNSDPNLFPPAAMFAAKNRFENKKKNGIPPVPDHPGKQLPKKKHGFDSVTMLDFKRTWKDEYKHSAFIFDADDTVRMSTGKEIWPLKPSEVHAIGKNVKAIKALIKKEKPDFLLGASNQSTHEKKEYKTPISVIDECFQKTNELTGLDIEWTYCPHYRFPVQCFCRKPHPGMGAHWITKHKLLPSKVTMFGDSTSDKTFAQRCGFKFVHVDDL